MQDRLFLTTPEAANRLGLAPRTLERWRWAGIGPGFVRLNGAVRYSRDTLDAWAAARTRSSTSDRGAGLGDAA
jgi:predicted site-specific integrase-resolvase